MHCIPGRNEAWWLDNPQPSAHIAERCQRPLELLARVRGRHDRTNASFAFWNGGKGDARCHHPFVEQLSRKLHRQLAFAHDDGSDWSLAGRGILAANVEPQAAEFLFEIPCVLPQSFHEPWLLLENVECRHAGGSHRWRVGGRKKKRTGTMVKKLDEIARTADVASKCTDGLR